jgi:hypothetical protein
MILAVGNDDQFGASARPAGLTELGTTRASLRNARTACATAPCWCRCWPEVMRGRTRSDWLERSRRRSVPCGPINDLAEVFADPQVQARGMTVTSGAPGLWPTTAGWASPMKLSQPPVQLPPPAAAPGRAHRRGAVRAAARSAGRTACTTRPAVKNWFTVSTMRRRRPSAASAWSINHGAGREAHQQVVGRAVVVQCERPLRQRVPAAHHTHVAAVVQVLVAQARCRPSAATRRPPPPGSGRWPCRRRPQQQRRGSRVVRGSMRTLTGRPLPAMPSPAAAPAARRWRRPSPARNTALPPGVEVTRRQRLAQASSASRTWGHSASARAPWVSCRRRAHEQRLAHGVAHAGAAHGWRPAASSPARPAARVRLPSAMTRSNTRNRFRSRVRKFLRCSAPPSTSIATPVIIAASSLHRKQAALPRSSGVEKRPIGMVERNLARISGVSSPMKVASSGVSPATGLSATTRMPKGASSTAIGARGGDHPALAGVVPGQARTRAHAGGAGHVEDDTPDLAAP